MSSAGNNGNKGPVGYQPPRPPNVVLPQSVPADSVAFIDARTGQPFLGIPISYAINSTSSLKSAQGFSSPAMPSQVTGAPMMESPKMEKKVEQKRELSLVEAQAATIVVAALTLVTVLAINELILHLRPAATHNQTLYLVLYVLVVFAITVAVSVLLLRYTNILKGPAGSADNSSTLPRGAGQAIHLNELSGQDAAAGFETNMGSTANTAGLDALNVAGRFPVPFPI